MPENNTTNENHIRQKIKKPIYKKWWFWIIVVIFSLIIMGSFGNNEPKKVAENSTTSSLSSNTTDSSSQSMGEQKEFKVGDVISFDDKELTVIAVKRNYNTGNQFSVPKSGKEFIKISVEIENKSKSEIYYNSYNFKLKDSNGSIKDLESETYSLDDSLDSGKLASNGKISGSMIFEVPKNDNNLTLIYEPSFWSSRRIEVKL